MLENMAELIYKEESYQIIGACLEVHKELGSGFLESVYHEALILELKNRSIPFESEKGFQIRYKNAVLSNKYFADFICYDKIIVEIKAVKELANEHRAQVYNYLKATCHKLAFLVNFGHYPKAQIERIIL